MKRVIIAGTHSGCGKTTLTCALLSALKKREMRVSAFKCGPDYIDPMFHREVIGIPAYNLDSFFCNDDTLKYLLHEHGKDSDISVIEGVMGFYDGVSGRGSAYSLSQITETPAVIVIDCKGMSDSVGAVMHGFLGYRLPNDIVGFIFNRLPERLIPFAKKICEEAGTRYYGCFPNNGITIESRHLGLVTAGEIADLREKLDRLGELAEKYIDIDGIINDSERAFPRYVQPDIRQLTDKKPVIAVARDRAFCFIYEDNIELLKKLGCEIRYFSPLADSKLPGNISGLILCGGYPELYAEMLSANTGMLSDIREKITNGLPAIAECGGFMYLHDTFTDMDGTEFSGAGVIHGKAYRTDRLQRFGYVTLTAENDNLLCKKNERFTAHEFHYFDSTCCGKGFTAQKADGREWECGHAEQTLYAGFPHLYFYADPEIAGNFVKICMDNTEK